MHNTSRSVVRMVPALRGKRLAALALAAIGLIAAGPQARALPVAVPNFSFESPVVANDGAFTAATGWVETGSGAHEGGAYNPTAANFAGAAGAGTLPGTAQGSQAGLMHAGGTASSSLTSAASLTTILPSTTYTLTVALGSASNAPATGQFISALTFAILANGVTVGQLNLDAKTIPVGTFTDYSTTFTTSAVSPQIGQSITVTIGHAADLDSSVIVDNVRLDASPVPEPTSLAAVAAGLALAGRRTRRATIANG